MKTLILYYSKYGTTERCAKDLAEKINEGVDIISYSQRKQADLDSYDTIIIGGPVYMGMLKKVKSFTEANLQKLLTKRVGLFICGMDKDEPLEEKIKRFFPPELIEHASSIMAFGGAIDTGKMGRFDKFIYEKVAKETGVKDMVNHEAVAEFANMMNV